MNKAWLTGVALAGIVFVIQNNIVASPAAPSSELAIGPYSHMHMLLEKTIFDIDVLTLDVQVDPPTQGEFRKLWSGHTFSEMLADQTAQILYNSQHVQVEMRFVRNVGFRRFIHETVLSAECARKANVITETEFKRVQTNIKEWYAAIAKSGIKSGDTISYDLENTSLHTTLRNKKGEVLVDQTDQGRQPGLSVLGGFFASCSNFRKPLIQSLK